MKVMVTGSEGSLAQILIPRLLEAGHEVHGFDNCSKYGPVERTRRYHFSQADLSDTGVVDDIFRQHSFDVVYHLAALIFGVVGFHERPADIIADNNLLTINLMKHGRDRIGKFVYLSSSMVYERCRVPHREEDADLSIMMSTSYGLSKYIGERIVRAFHEQYKIAYVIWRPFNIITPFETYEEDGFSHVFADMIEKIIVQRQNPLRVLGDGRQVRCFTNIYDVADAIAGYSLRPEAENQIFNIGNVEPFTVLELTELIRSMAVEYAILPNHYELQYEHLPIYDDDVRIRIPDISKIKRVFDWEPRIKLEESLRQYMTHRFGERPQS